MVMIRIDIVRQSEVGQQGTQRNTSKSALLRSVKSRYGSLDIKPMTSIKTVEFRLHNGTTDSLRLFVGYRFVGRSFIRQFVRAIGAGI